MPSTSPQTPNVPTKILFGIGSSAESLHAIAFQVFCFYLYAQVVGLDPALVGLAVGLALAVDAITDPLVGNLSDKFQSRYGRRHPLMLASALPTAVMFFALFSPPQILEDSQIGLFLYLLATMVGVRVSLTFFQIPHLAFGSEMDPDYVGKSKVMAYHTFCLWIGGALVAFFGNRIFFGNSDIAIGCAIDNCLDSRENYHYFGLSWAIVLFSLITVSTLGTAHRIKYLATNTGHEDDKSGKTSKLSASNLLLSGIRDLKELLQNSNYRYLLLGMVSLAATSGMHEALTTHIVKFYWEFNPDQYSYYGLVTAPAFILTFIIAPWLHKAFGKRIVMAISALGMGIAAMLPIALRILNILPENHSDLLLPTILTFVGCYYFFNGMLIISVMSALADVSQQFELESGKKREGLVYSVRNFAGKLTSGFGLLLAGVALSVIGFPAKETDITKIEPHLIDEIGYIYLFTGLFALMAGYFYGQYKLTLAEHSKILQQLLSKQNAGAD